MAGRKVQVTGTWRLVNREAKGVGVIRHLSAPHFLSIWQELLRR